MLTKLARERQVSEDVLVEQALDLLFEAGDAKVWAAMSAPSLNRVWDNQADAVYDDWTALTSGNDVLVRYPSTGE